MKNILLRWHKQLVWLALVALVCWSISGISHPLMAWFGPQAHTMMPPHLAATASHIPTLRNIIDTQQLTTAAIAKLVPTAHGPMLQLTAAHSAAPRRYFALDDGLERQGYDSQQAKWLASHYTGMPVNTITAVEYLTEFNASYPRVNRLLPVYKVSFSANKRALTAYVYTETNSLAALSNPAKARLQAVFQALHTWQWLNATGHARVILLALLLLSLLAMASSGLVLLLSLRTRALKAAPRQWHRRLGYCLWLPLIAWSASGFYHLLQSEYLPPISGLRLGEPIDLQQWARLDIPEAAWHNALEHTLQADQKLTAIALVKHAHKYYMRLSLAPTATANTRTARFNGQPSEGGVVYIDSATGHTDGLHDRDHALYLAQGLAIGDVQQIQPIYRFSASYDFRNKRLPVWQVDFDNSSHSRAFIDPASGLLVDQNRRIDRAEAWSFAMLHKWNMFTPIIGRQWRDAAIIACLLACLGLGLLGLCLHLKRRRPARLHH